MDAEIRAELDLIHEKLDKLIAGQEPIIVAPPDPSGGLFKLVRPDSVEPRYGEGVPMTTPDVEELLKRAVYGVTWAGTVARFGRWYDEVWEEIDRLKAGDPDVVKHYYRLDPEFAGVALLTGLIDLPKYDGLSSVGRTRRMKTWPGWSVQTFLDQQFKTSGGPSGE